MLLDIVARSLYSENEVFVRELISNASDALEKFRYTIHTAGENEKNYEQTDRPLEIHIGTDKSGMQLTVQDTGIGMTKEELVNCLGTIARSGSKKFMEQIKESGGALQNSDNIIGENLFFFYLAFMTMLLVFKVPRLDFSNTLSTDVCCYRLFCQSDSST